MVRDFRNQRGSSFAKNLALRELNPVKVAAASVFFGDETKNTAVGVNHREFVDGFSVEGLENLVHPGLGKEHGLRQDGN